MQDVSYSIMLYEGELKPAVDIWAFGRPLTWQLWVVFAATVLALPLLFFVMEKLNADGFIPLTKTSSHDIRFAMCEWCCPEPWATCACCTHLHVPGTTCTAADRNVLAIFTQEWGTPCVLRNPLPP